MMTNKAKGAQLSFRERLRSKEEWFTGYLFVAPAMIIFVMFVFYPFSNTIIFSFQETSLLNPEVNWIGFDNYRRLFSDQFFMVIRQTTYFVLGTVIVGTVLALLTALLLTKPLKFIGFYRTVFYLPVVTSMVAVSVVWLWMYEPRFGIINHLLGFFGVPQINWLTDTRTAMPAIIILAIWRDLGYRATIFMAGIFSIPTELYEAAKIDGANSWNCFWRITLPLLQPTTFFVVVTSVIASFQVFAPVNIMTSGGPADSTNVVVFYMWRYAFRYFQMGYASAVAVALALVIFAVTFIQWKLGGNKNFSMG